jgi:hypothetical protein
MYDGKLALTTAQAATRYDLDVATMRKAIQRLVTEGKIEALPEPLDGRTPLYLASDIDKAMKNRPGKGVRPRELAR